MDLSLGFALFRTKRQVQVQIEEALAGRAITINVTNYDQLIAEYPANEYNGDFAYVQESEGTPWLPGSLGGTYYPNGLYWSNGTSWLYTASPAQATQAEVNAGTNDDKFVTPLTFNNASKWSTKQNSISVSDITTNANFYPVFVNAAGVLSSLNISTSKLYVNPSNGNINSAGNFTGVGVTASTFINCSGTISSSIMSTAQLNGIQIISTDGGSDSTSALVLTGQNGYGGANYYGAVTFNNTGGTNGKKYIRIDNTGKFEIVNNAYSSVILSLTDAGELHASSISGDTITSTGNLNVTGFINGSSTIIGNSGTAFKATGNAVNSVSLEMANTSAIRNIGDVAENYMYFDINTGGSNRGNFRFRGTNSYTTYATINPDGIQALTPYVNKTSYNVGLDTVIAVDNIKCRVSNQGGIFPQVASNTGGNVDVCYSGIGYVSGAVQTPAYAGNSGILLNSSWVSVYSSHGMDTRGDQFVLTITDKNAGKIYRITYLVTNNSSNTTGYNIIAERLI